MVNKKSFNLFLSIALAGLFVSVSAFAYGGEAVIVYNPSTSAWGSYHGAPTLGEAEQAAQNACGAGCTVETYVRNGWVALARNANGSYGTSGLHDSEYDAEQSALGNCEQSATSHGLAPGSCYVLRSTSSYDYQPDYDGVRPAN